MILAKRWLQRDRVGAQVSERLTGCLQERETPTSTAARSMIPQAAWVRAASKGTIDKEDWHSGQDVLNDEPHQCQIKAERRRKSMSINPV